ncbi:MAG: Nramp family divalent metal transporter [Actinomycetota bacterium]|nr:Nramp family divalent metal transporter [Actinomycetota bacterium]
MAEVTRRRDDGFGGETASEIPDRHLPGVPYADLPEPIPFGRVVGPSVLLLAGAIGSGEFVIWPYIASQTGLALVWLAILGVATQYFINMEIERYTLATGETAVTGFTRLWKPWGLLFIVMTVVPWAWPGWATGGSTTLTFAFGLSEGAIVPITIATLVLIGVVLTVSPVVYQTVEKVQFLLVGLILLFIAFAAIRAISGDAWVAFGQGLVNVGQIPSAIATIPAATLLGALAFAGAGGSLNLVQSNWIRDKGLGMGARIPKIVSPLTGQEEARPSLGYFFRQDEQNMRRWNGWWRLANREQMLTFLLIGALAIVLLMILTFSTLGVGSEAESFDFIRLEGEALQALGGSWLGTVFWLTGTIVLVSTNLAVLDMVGRVTADVLKVGPLRDNQTWTESKVYFAVVWAEIAFGSIILLSGIDQPLVLLIIASSLNGLVMFVYSFLLIRLNRNVLPSSIGLGGGRLAAMWWAVLFYGFFSAFVVVDFFIKLVTGQDVG